jgi:2-oxo-4-hydroxy-4-carboxy-5-ureidoimidazoline decarboxylase
MNAVLAHWNQLPPDEAAQAILPCNGSHAWASAMSAERPFESEEPLLAASDRIWSSLPEAAWQQAFDSHPRIGERHAKAASASSLQWSSQEQSNALGDDTAAALAAGNAAYEAKFGRIFLICASGRSASEILAALQQRMNNDAATEGREAAEQQRRITHLRLKRWLGGT